MKFYTAILKAIDTKRQASANFSAYEITKTVREMVNDQSVDLDDKICEVIGGVDTFRIDHEEVKEYIRELKDNGLLANYTKDEIAPGGNYRVFIYEGPLALQSFAISPAVCCPVTKAQTASFSTPLAAKSNYPLLESKIRDYVCAKHNESIFPTAKMIQSRMKGFGLTCGNIVNICESLGFKVFYYSRTDKSTHVIQPQD